MDNFNTRLALVSVQEAYSALNRRFAMIPYDQQASLLDEMIQLDRTIRTARAQADRDSDVTNVIRQLKGE